VCIIVDCAFNEILDCMCEPRLHFSCLPRHAEWRRTARPGNAPDHSTDFCRAERCMYAYRAMHGGAAPLLRHALRRHTPTVPSRMAPHSWTRFPFTVIDPKFAVTRRCIDPCHAMPYGATPCRAFLRGAAHLNRLRRGDCLSRGVAPYQACHATRGWRRLMACR
jgi:hypothetical protein